MGTTYQQLLMNGLNQIISNLTAGIQPAKDPGKTAWAWLTASVGTEPSEVNSYIQGQFNSASVSTVFSTPTKNWLLWSNAMNTAFSSATGSVALWLATQYSGRGSDLPTVPEDVIGWTKQQMPTGITGVALRSGAAIGVGGG